MKYCPACDKFSGHRASKCPDRPLSRRVEVTAVGPRRPVAEPTRVPEECKYCHGTAELRPLCGYLYAGCHRCERAWPVGELPAPKDSRGPADN